MITLTIFMTDHRIHEDCRRVISSNNRSPSTSYTQRESSLT
ncbi:unnamed protein product [Larinioides sclopetarius]|uniref:Uncharacterized protein n=1 Tax=Larinioides sclopetarius TaxID=280406 RepID=A0AAV2AH75_9ARAC